MAALDGAGRTIVAAPPETVWATLLDPARLQRIIPGAVQVTRIDALAYRATLAFGVGPFRSRYAIELLLTEARPPSSLVLHGRSHGAFGQGQATGTIALSPHAAGTALDWRYEGSVSGPVSLAGGPLLRAASQLFATRVFAALARLAPSPRR